MNTKSNSFNSLTLFVLSLIVGLSLPIFGSRQADFNPVEATIERILLSESKLLEGDLRKNFVPYLVATAKDYEVDPLLVLAVMKVESTFKPDVISYAGAYGLLQVKPVAAREVAKVFGNAEAARGNLLDPYHNVQVGVQYLSYLRKLFARDHVRMLSAYNMGPTTVRRTGLQSSRYSRKVMAAYQKFLSHDSAMVLAKR